MATRKIKDAKDLSTNELIYFKGHSQATYMSDGRTVEEAIPTKFSDLENDQSLVNQFQLATINGQSLVNDGQDITIESGGGGEIEPIPSDDFFSGVPRFYIYKRGTNTPLFTGLMVGMTWAELCDRHPSFLENQFDDSPSFHDAQIYNEDETIVSLSDTIEAKIYIC